MDQKPGKKVSSDDRKIEQTEVRQDRRIFKGAYKFHHDRFKLEIADVMLNISYTKTKRFDPIQHQHWFHTVDSDGKVQKFSSAMAGHFHEMEVINDPKGGLPSVKCGPARQWSVERTDTGTRRVSAPIDEKAQHLHEISYRDSEEIEVRSMSIEAAKVQVIDADKTKPIPGILG